MRLSNDRTRAVIVCLAIAVALAVGLFRGEVRAQTASNPIQTVFVIVFENYSWSQILDNPSAPYINGLLPSASRAEQYYTPPGIHASTPNYLWMEAGQDFGLTGVSGFTPALYAQNTTAHLVTQLAAAGIPWKTYQESMPAGTCPLTDASPYAVRHNPFVFFTDVTNNNDPNSANCIAHVRPYSELATDLAQNTVARYNFITPNVCNDMHDCGIASGDTWLANELPKILASQAYQNGGAVFITWDEGEGAASDGPLGMIVMSPTAKGHGYYNSLYYTHSSLLLTLQEIFGVRPLLGDAGGATDLSDLFASFPAVLPSTPTPVSGTSAVSTNVTLRWSSSGSSDDVYFGTTSPPPLVASSVATQSYTPGTLVTGATYYWQVVSRTAAGTTAGPVWTFTPGTGSLPGAWSNKDIGAVGVGGRASYATNTFTVVGAGADIGGTADAFQFVSQPFGGSAQVMARVTGLQNTSSAAKAGITLRDSADPGSAHVTLDVTPGGTVELRQRSSAGAATTIVATTGVPFPISLRLTRTGTSVTASVSGNGTTWTTLGAVTVTLPGTVPLLGLVVSSHTTAATAAATFDMVTVTSSVDVSPANPTPYDGATGVSATPTLGWTAAGATSYDVALGTSNPPAIAVAGLTAASYSPQALTAGTTYFWQVTAHDSFGTTSGPVWAFKTAAGASVSLAPWTDQDVGSVGAAGSATFSGTAYTVKGAGADIWGTADAFNFLSQPFSSDGQIIARVTSLQNTSAYAKAGVMLRESTASGAPHVILDAKPDGSVEFMQRAASGGTTSFIAGATVGMPAWLRLSRTGTTVTAAVSTNGSTWTTVGTTTVGAAANPLAGLAVTSHSTSVLTTAVFDTVSLAAAAAPPPGAPATPSPASGATGVGTSPTLTWSSNGATSYDVSFGTANPPPAVALGLTVASYAPATTLASGATYFWQIVARNSSGTTAGPVWSLTTAAAPTLPGTPTSPNPANGTTGVASNAVLTWSGTGATSYTVNFGTSSPPPQVATGLTTASYSPGNLSGSTGFYWQITAVNANGATAGPLWSFTTAASPPPPPPAALPAPWNHQDLGNTGIDGTASEASGLFTVSGAGSDIWSTADGLQYVYQPLAANGQIVARVASLQNTNGKAKAGVMVRAALTANAAEATVAVQPGGGVVFLARSSTGGPTKSVATSAARAFPVWLKLTRTGSTMTSYVSANGTTWTQVGTTTISVPGSIYIGLAVTSHSTSQATTATFDNVTVAALP